MSRRVRLPDDIFRPTAVPDPTAEPSPVVELPAKTPAAAKGRRTASGRVKHDEKMTVYVTAEELLEDRGIGFLADRHLLRLPDGTDRPVRITGTVTNQSAEAWTGVNLYAFASTTPIVDATSLAASAAVDPLEYVGDRIVEGVIQERAAARAAYAQARQEGKRGGLGRTQGVDHRLEE